MSNLVDLPDAAINCASPVFFDDAANGAIYAQGTTVGRASAIIDWGKAKKPRPTPGLVDSPLRLINVNDVQACGENLLAAAMVTDIRRCTEGANPISKIKRDGFTLVARSIDYWKKHFNITSTAAVRTAIKHMKNSELVVCSDEWFNGNLTPHYRMASAGVKNDTSLIKKEAEGVEIDIPHVNSDTPHVKNDTPITQKVKAKVETEKSKSTSVTEENPVTTGTPEISQANSGETEPQTKTTPVASIEITPKAEKKETNPEVGKKGSSPKLASGKQPNKWVARWQERFEAKHPGLFVLPKVIAIENYVKVMKNQVYQAIGDQTPFIDFLIERWQSLRDKSLPINVYPCMTQVTEFIELLIQQYVAHLKVEERKAEARAEAKAKAAEREAKKAAQALAGTTPLPASPVAPKPVKTDLALQQKYLAMAAALNNPIIKTDPKVPAVDPRIADLPIDRDPWPLHTYEERAAAFRQWLAENPPKVAA
jgi:hypothetical protein